MNSNLVNADYEATQSNMLLSVLKKFFIGSKDNSVTMTNGTFSWDDDKLILSGYVSILFPKKCT